MNLRHVAFVAIFVSSALFCQEYRGTISGAVTDPSGSAVPNAKITVTETHTGTRIPTVSDSSGQYAAPFLLPGDYDISITAQGFTAVNRKGIHVNAGDHPVIDIRLAVGDVTTIVDVVADASQLNTENASVGQSISTKEVADLPINGRTPMIAASLSLGVIGYAQPTLIHPFDAGAAAGWSVGGAYQQTSELLVDGSPNATWDGRLAYSPPQDAVQEVRVKVSDSDSAFGHSGGGTLNQITKTGTNSLHGSAWEFNQPNTLTANDFFLNQAGKPRPVTHFNQYGVTAGGPVYIPHFVDTRNRLFWFFAWEGIKDAQPNPYTTSVPTDAERKGDLSGFLTADNLKIYDPYSVVASTGARSVFPNNQIPQVAPYVNPVAQAYLKFYPEPNVAYPVAKLDGTNNYTTAPNTPDIFSNELGRLDYNMNDKSRLFFDVRHTDYSQTKNNYFNNLSTGSTLFRVNWGLSADEVYTFTPTTILDFRVNFTRLGEGHDVPSVGFDSTSLGFPSSMATNSTYQALPILNFSTGWQKIGNTGTGADRLPSQSGQIFASLVKVMGNHTLKFGGDIRQYRLNTFTAGNSAGTFTFGNNFVTASNTTSSSVVFGQDVASFLMGLPTGGSFDVNTFASWYSYYSAGFFQDDWRITKNLTVNLGVRYEHDGPYNEKYGRTVDGFDTTDANPLATAAKTAYATAPLAQLPASQFNVLGGLTFPSNGQTAVYNNTSHLVSPRAGFAWTPQAFHGKTAVRGGFGLFVAPVSIAWSDVNGKFSTSPQTNQEGFSQTTSLVPTTDNYITPAATLSNPFPTGMLKATGSALGLATFAGQNISFLNPNMKSPYSLRWNIGVQQSLTKDLMLEVVYIGNHSVHLPIDYTQLNGLPRSVMSTLPTRDPAEAYLTTTVANPFLGLATTAGTAKTVQVNQLLARYPEFPVGDSGSGWNGGGGILEENLNAGDSYFDSLNVRLQKRLSHGLSMTFNYIHSRLIEQTTWLNASDPAPEKRISVIDHPDRFVTAFVYELPIGKGRLLNLKKGWVDSVVGGWNLNTVYTYQTGAPLQWTNGSSTSPGDYVYFGAPLVLNNRMADPGTTAFNIGAFDTVAADQFNYHLRTFPTTVSALRMDGINQWDPSVMKSFHFTEKSFFQLRFEMFNVLNHPVFPAPNMVETNKAFGTITGAQANRPRSIQLGAHFVF